MVLDPRRNVRISTDGWLFGSPGGWGVMRFLGQKRDMDMSIGRYVSLWGGGGTLHYIKVQHGIRDGTKWFG